MVLAPWSSLELATSPGCANEDGYRAIVQTARPWLDVEGAPRTDLGPGMTALVRWSKERVCIEAVEVGIADGSADAEADGIASLHPMAVARFVGSAPGSALVGTGPTSMVQKPIKCELAAGLSRAR